MSAKPRYLTRKDIASILNVSNDTVRGNERKWGIIEAKVILNARLVRYDAAVLAQILWEKFRIRL